jgi:hypothetical protein
MHIKIMLPGDHRPQSSSASRVTTGALGFLNLTQCGKRPERYTEPSQFDAVSSQPIRATRGKRGGAPREIKS